MSLGADVYKRIDTVFEKAAADGRNMLFEHEVYDILGNAGLDVPHYVSLKNLSMQLRKY